MEAGQAVEITRRGNSVAVVISLADYERLANITGTFGEAYAAWRRTVDNVDLDLPDDYFDSIRDRSVGRQVDL